MNCQYCGRVFNRGYNLRRHEDEYCPYREEDNSSDECSPPKKSRDAEDDEDDVSSSSCDESSEYSEDDDEIKEEIDPWATLIEDAKVIVRSKYEELLNVFQMNGQDKNIAKQKAFEKILPDFQKEFADVYMDNIRWIKALKKDAVHRKIMQTKEALINEDSFDPDEALSAAVDKRKFLLKKLLKGQGRFSDNDDDDDE